MISVQYKAKSGKTQFKPTLAHLHEMLEEDQGFCLACGETQDGVEPDAVRYKCECCGEPRVYGAAELALMGLVA
jgi:Zn finger protein HypA/HybF involved in hydrogenase expression